MIHLRGIAWDHPRGYGPIKATTEEFQKNNPEISISWDIRSLTDFANYPIEPLVEKYDLILIDHPHMGAAFDKKALLPLDEWVPADFMKDQEENSVGPSYDSYTWGGHQWALGIDAAAHVSAYRKDLLDGYGLVPPKTWTEVFSFVEALPPNLKVGLPLHPIDCICSFISLGANMNNSQFYNESTGFDSQIAEEVLAFQRKIATLVHPESLQMNPIKMFDFMSDKNEIAYIPLAFAYSNYSRSDYASNVIHFTNIPTFGETPNGAILGGVGIAVSSKCTHKNEAVRYAMYVASEECQRSLYFMSGGQPGYRKAWTDPEVNRKSHDFFESTLLSHDLAYIRPRYHGYHLFQDKAGNVIHEFLQNGGSIKETARNINQLHVNCRNLGQ